MGIVGICFLDCLTKRVEAFPKADQWAETIAKLSSVFSEIAEHSLFAPEQVTMLVAFKTPDPHDNHLSQLCKEIMVNTKQSQ